jgi:hypothetical protein
MVAFAEIVQTLDRLQKVADAGLLSSLPSLEEVGRQAFRRAIASAATTGQRVASSVAADVSVALGSDLSVDVAISKLDPTKGMSARTFSIEGGKDHPWIKEDLANLTHATAEKERVDRERGRGSHQPFINPVPQTNSITPWASPEPPTMREGAQMQSRHPLMKL